MSTSVKRVKTIRIETLEEDLNIDCKTENVEIYSNCIQNFETYCLGTQDFFDSVKSMKIINYSKHSTDVFEGLEIVDKYFPNLKRIDLWNITSLSIPEIVEILKNHKINKISIGSKYSSTSLESKSGCLVLYDGNNQHFVKFSQLRLEHNPSSCEIHGEYAYFDYAFARIDLTFEGLVIGHEDYEKLDLRRIDGCFIILHTIYLHKLISRANEIFKVKYLPTKSLELNMWIENEDELDQYKQYLADNSLKNFTTKLIYNSSDKKYGEELTEAAFNSLNVKELIYNY